MKEPSRYKIELEWYECYLASVLGAQRASMSLKDKTRVKFYWNEDDFDETDGNGAGGELAVAKFLHLYPILGVNSPTEPDVWPNIEVRSTKYRTGHLKVNDKNPDDRPYVLVTGSLPKYELVGWMWGHKAKRKEWYTDPNNKKDWAYFVPQLALRPIDELLPALKDIIMAERARTN
jgi:hypothetical protein